MIRLLITALIFFFLYRFAKRAIGSIREIGRAKSSMVVDEMVQDPLCKTYIPRREALRRVVEGQEFHFCSDKCAEQFESEKNPD